VRSLKPKIILLAESKVDVHGLDALLSSIGAPEWDTIAQSDSDRLTEIGGRLCYKSFKPGLNANVTKVREGNAEYINNILKQKHGSVLEHASVTFVLLNVSRILTHELVRHRAGVAISQESMRFVRLDDIGMIIPNLTDEFMALSKFGVEPEGDPIPDAQQAQWAATMQAKFQQDICQVTENAENLINFIGSKLDVKGVPFHVKKTITSALRRMAPGGHTTNIMVTANHRAWRHMIEARTSVGAEVEIREVFFEIFRQLKEHSPALYQDANYFPSRESSDCHVRFDNSKV
jgi:thymidylate synthase (FAD)